jgi:hypothetical protein
VQPIAVPQRGSSAEPAGFFAMAACRDADHAAPLQPEREFLGHPGSDEGIVPAQQLVILDRGKLAHDAAIGCQHPLEILIRGCFGIFHRTHGVSTLLCLLLALPAQLSLTDA